MPQRRNNPNHPFVAKPNSGSGSGDPQNRSRITIETPGVRDEGQSMPEAQRAMEIQKRGGAWHDSLKYQPGTGLNDNMQPGDPLKQA